jgi:hypothetical protein
MTKVLQTLLPKLRGNFVLLKADRLQLLLPQQDVGAAEYLDTAPRDSGQPGLFELDSKEEGGATRFLAALSTQMNLLPQYPKGRFLLTSFEAQGGMLMCWNEVKVLIDADLQPQRLPEGVLSPDAPLREYVEFGDELVFCCTAQRLLEHAFAAKEVPA